MAERTDNMVCNRCREFLYWIPDPIITSPYPTHVIQRHQFKPHTSWDDWEASIKQGCILCRYVQRQLHYDIDRYMQRRESSQKPFYSWRWKLGKWDLILEPGNQGRGIVLFEIEPPKDRLNLPDKLKIPDYLPTANTGSAQSLAIAAHWLKTCEESHTRCKRARSEEGRSWRPTRLIRLDENGDNLRLVEGDEIPEAAVYATLSHCWGAMEQKLLLTLENLEQWKISIPPLDGRKTFQDAISVTRYLRLQYIWIDSLCIIQNSVDDWRNESTLMSKVYKFSACNISATQAKDDRAGCFFSRELVDFPRNRIRLTFTKDPTGHVHGYDRHITIPGRPDSDRLRPGHYELIQLDSFTDWTREVDDGHVNTRAWVVQELLLSPRVVHFCQKQLYWECTELQASETFPFGLPDHPGHQYARIKLESPFSLSNANPEPPSNLFKRAMRVWAQAVAAFASSDLTYPTDKLVAISAIAKEIKPHMRCKYLAGLWETDLVHQLSWTGPWQALRPKGPPYVAPYVAPSWSWASAERPLPRLLEIYEWFDPDYSFKEQSLPLVEVLECHTQLASADDDTGQVTGGFLKLRGQLIQVQYRQHHNITKNKSYQRDIDFMDRTPAGMSIWHDGETYANTSAPSDGVETSWWCLPIEISYAADGAKLPNEVIFIEDNVRMNVLLLRKTGSSDHFTRAGIAYMYNPLEREYTGPKNLFVPLFQRVAVYGERIPNAFQDCSGIREVTIF
ncbi:Heterokaryon incompatibility protein (HET) domain containing protein [Rhypophila sp. PSN 637]